MRYSTMELIDGELKETFSKEVSQDSLTSDCWMIQFKGLDACKKCEFKNTNECGGGATLKKMKQKSKNVRAKNVAVLKEKSNIFNGEKKTTKKGRK